MLKYTDVCVTFAEIPDEINLCINVTSCDGLCQDCHTPELRQDIGNDLEQNIVQLIHEHSDVSCIVFMGEGRKQGDTRAMWKHILHIVRFFFPDKKFALYSGRPEVEEDFVWEWDYLKVGPYIPTLGPLNSPTTNQRLYVIDRENKTKTDITYKFQGGKL